jgi:hypothetical protein
LFFREFWTLQLIEFLTDIEHPYLGEM